MSDLIDRQAAIDALDKRFDDVPMELTTEILQLRHDLRERIPSAQPATNCSEIPNKSDTISRQAALDAIMGQPPEPHYPAWYAAQIEELPVVQPEHKTGRWMFGFNNRYLEKYYYCSNCGCRKYTEDEPSDYFCSKCGADMRGGEME